MRGYLEVFRNRHARALIFAAFPARLAYGMIGLAVYFKVENETHSIAFAGLAAGISGIVGSATTGLRAMAIERLGSTIPLRVFAPGYAAGIMLVNLVHDKPLLLLSAAVLGATAPPINLSVRPMWKKAVPEDLYRTAIALDTVSLEAGVILGPPIATFLALSSHPSAALTVCSILILIGGLSLSALPFVKEWEPEKKVEGQPGVFRSPAMRLLLVEAVVIGFANGNGQIAIPALSTLFHQPRFAGVVFAVNSTAAICGSLLAGTLGKHISPLNGFRSIYIFWVLASIPLAFFNPGFGFLSIIFLGGFIGGAEHVFYLDLLEVVRPVGASVSALGWLWTIEGSLTAVGQTTGGYVSQHASPHYCFALASVLMAIGLAITFTGSRWLVATKKPEHESN